MIRVIENRGGLVYFLRSPLVRVSSLFLAGGAAVALPLALGTIGPWQAAELSVYGLLLAALVYVARLLWRLRGEVWSARLHIDGQGLECDELAAQDRVELESRMEELLDRISRGADLVAGPQETGHEDRRADVPVPSRPVDADQEQDVQDHDVQDDVQGQDEEETVVPAGERGSGSAVSTEAAGAATGG